MPERPDKLDLLLAVVSIISGAVQVCAAPLLGEALVTLGVLTGGVGGLIWSAYWRRYDLWRAWVRSRQDERTDE